jgi:Cu2+-exporting ATPase
LQTPGQISTDSNPASPAACFHCGLPVPPGSAFRVEVGGEWKNLCCPGCETLARVIVGQGLDDYYRLRQSVPEAPGRAGAGETDDGFDPDLSLYDEPLLQARFVREVQGQPEAELLLEGIRCAACVWLIEQTLARIPGVTGVEVNYTSHRARVRWNAAATKLSAVLLAVRRIGYRAWPYEEGRLALIEKGERRSAVWRLFVAGFGMMQVMMYAVPVYLADEGSMSADIEQLMRWASLVLTLPVMVYSAAPFFSGALRDLRMARLGMDVPVAIGIAVAFIASVWATVNASGAVYFDSVTMFVFLLLAGRYLELLARQSAGRTLQHLARLAPETAHRFTHETTDETETVARALLVPGDRVLVRPGETLPADGQLESRRATLSEALLTGESRPLSRLAGAALVGGSVNSGSALTMRVTRVGGDTALAAIMRLMERAASERPRWVELAQRAAGWFVAVILLLSLAAGLAWMQIDPARALWIAVSVLVVTCPCALSLATPVALTVATGEMARRNLIVTRGHAIESLAAATDLVFDKTGTLTRGQMRVLESLALGERGADACLAIAAAIERSSEHPLARALVDAAGARPLPLVDETNNAPGAGIEAVLLGRRYRIGRADYVAALHGQAVPIAWLHATDSVVWLGDGTGWLAAFRVGDSLRPDAGAAIASLRQRGYRVHLLSGDDHAVARRTAATLGIELVRAPASPAEKQAYVKALQARGARVAMIGDGINDTPVLAQADVSVAMGGGSDLARIRADAVLVGDSLDDLAAGIAVARRTRTVIRQNLAWALAYNLVVLPLAFAGWVTPWIAGIGMSASSLVVVLNALRIRRDILQRTGGKAAPDAGFQTMAD